MTETELLDVIKEYFEKKILDNHRKKTLKDNSKLKSYKINPILVKYLSEVLVDDYNPIGVAKALYYPRVLGTSITTSFGSRIQKMFVELNMAEPCMVKGMDIVYIDKRTNEKKWCQLKSGPNNINHDDVKTIFDHFQEMKNRGRTNSINIADNDLVVGVIYGEEDQLSQHYKKISTNYPVIIGTDFWHSITGYENFYNKLVNELDSLILNFNNGDDFFENGYMLLAKEVETSELFDFK